MQWLGYETMSAFTKAINKAVNACTALNIPILENFLEENREISGKVERDYKLSRFACYLTAMNGDSRKPQVAKAQVYFASLAQTIQNYIQESENVERVIIRDEISDHEKSLSATAYQSGVVNYPFFQNAGYRGLYNMDLYKLRKRKGVVAKRTLLDFMGKEELAANLFRITQTEAKIRNERVKGQKNLEETAENVGRKVRKTMQEISGTNPESLPISQDIKQVRTGLKSTHRQLKKIDANKSPGSRTKKQ
jgi:DNA-damage-inducible protein D